MNADLYIDTPEALVDLCDRLRGSPYLAFDTEFIGDTTYFPRLCLLQIANESIVACIDPLKLGDLTPLLALLYDPASIKVMHAGFQDLMILFNIRGELPGPIFDTQIAAMVLGKGDQIGYGNLVRDILGVELDKSNTRADWSRRPLGPDLVKYAADDVRYLRQVYVSQKSELEKRERLHWLDEDFAELSDPARYRNDPQEAWRRLKGLDKLKGRQLAVLQSVAAWRETRAREENKPRRWMMSDDVLLDVARFMPADLDKLGHIRGLEQGVVKRHGNDLLARVQAACALPESQWPILEPKLRLTEAQDTTVDLMSAVLSIRAKENHVSAAVLASRKELDRVASGDTTVPVLHGWRGAIVGRDLLAMREGKLALRVNKGVPEIVPVG